LRLRPLRDKQGRFTKRKVRKQKTFRIRSRSPSYDLKQGADRRDLYEQVEKDYARTFKRIGPRKGSALRVEMVATVEKKRGKKTLEKRVFRDLETFEKFLVARYRGEREIDWEEFDSETKIRLVWRSKLQRHAKPVYHYHYKVQP